MIWKICFHAPSTSLTRTNVNSSVQIKKRRIIVVVLKINSFEKPKCILVKDSATTIQLD